MSNPIYLATRYGRDLALIQRTGRAGMTLAASHPADADRRTRTLAQCIGQRPSPRQTALQTINVPLAPREATIRSYGFGQTVRDQLNARHPPLAASRRAQTVQTLRAQTHDPLEPLASSPGARRRHGQPR